MRKVFIDANGSTSNAEWILSRLDLTGVTKVNIRKLSSTDGGPADVTFVFKSKDELTVRNGFGVGYGGTGPTGLYKILCRIGFDKAHCEQIFSCHMPELTLYGPDF